MPSNLGAQYYSSSKSAHIETLRHYSPVAVGMIIPGCKSGANGDRGGNYSQVEKREINPNDWSRDMRMCDESDLM